MSSDPQGATLSGPNMLPHLTNPRKEIRGQRSVPGQGGKPVFRLIPSRLELFPGSSSDMVLMGSSDKPKVRHLVYVEEEGEQNLGGCQISVRLSPCLPRLCVSVSLVALSWMATVLMSTFTLWMLPAAFCHPCSAFVLKTWISTQRRLVKHASGTGPVAFRSHLQSLFRCSPGPGPGSEARL